MDARVQTDLLERARHGDASAFAEVFEGMRPMVFAIAYRLVGPNDAEDVVMDSYLKAWTALPRFQGRASLTTWLYRIAHNCALDALRRRQVRQPEVELGSGSDGEEVLELLPDTHQRSPGDTVAGAEIEGLVGKALESLPPEHRATLLLRFSDGLSYAEIAAATGVSIGTVMSRIFNGRRKLIRKLKTMEIENQGVGGA